MCENAKGARKRVVTDGDFLELLLEKFGRNGRFSPIEVRREVLSRNGYDPFLNKTTNYAISLMVRRGVVIWESGNVYRMNMKKE